MKKGFFDMTRHERRGTIVVLAIIAAIVAVTFALRNSSPTPVEVSPVEIQRFEAEADTSVVTAPQRESKKRTDSKSPSKSLRKPSPKKPKPAREPRRLEPVPEF